MQIWRCDPSIIILLKTLCTFSLFFFADFRTCISGLCHLCHAKRWDNAFASRVPSTDQMRHTWSLWGLKDDACTGLHLEPRSLSSKQANAINLLEALSWFVWPSNQRMNPESIRLILQNRMFRGRGGGGGDWSCRCNINKPSLFLTYVRYSRALLLFRINLPQLNSGRSSAFFVLTGQRLAQLYSARLGTTQIGVFLNGSMRTETRNLSGVASLAIIVVYLSFSFSFHCKSGEKNCKSLIVMRKCFFKYASKHVLAEL